MKGKRVKTFRELTESLERKYVAVQFDYETQEKLRRWSLDQGFDLTKSFDGTYQGIHDFDFHCTVFFTTSLHPSDIVKNGEYAIDTILPGKKQISLTAKKFVAMGLEKDIPALELDGSDIFDIRNSFEQGFGMEDPWDTYKPHVSLSYARDASIMPADGSNIKPDFKLTASYIKIDTAADL